MTETPSLMRCAFDNHQAAERYAMRKAKRDPSRIHALTAEISTTSENANQYRAIAVAVVMTFLTR